MDKIFENISNKIVFMVLFILVIILGIIFIKYILSKRKEVQKESITLTNMMYIVALSSFAIVIGLFEIPVFTTGAKIDLSEVVVLISFLLLGFKGSVLVILFRSGIRFFITTMATSVFEADPIFKLFGEGLAVAASLLILFSLIIAEHVLNKKRKPLIIDNSNEKIENTLLDYIITPLITTILLTTVMTVIHFFITVPFYGTMLGIKDSLSNKEVILVLLGLFGTLNIIKGVISPVIYLALKPKIANIIR